MASIAWPASIALASMGSPRAPQHRAGDHPGDPRRSRDGSRLVDPGRPARCLCGPRTTAARHLGQIGRTHLSAPSGAMGSRPRKAHGLDRHRLRVSARDRSQWPAAIAPTALPSPLCADLACGFIVRCPIPWEKASNTCSAAAIPDLGRRRCSWPCTEPAPLVSSHACLGEHKRFLIDRQRPAP